MNWGTSIENVLKNGLPSIFDEPRENVDQNTVLNGSTNQSKPTEQNYDKTVVADTSTISMLKNNKELLIMGGLGVAAILVIVLAIKK